MVRINGKGIEKDASYTAKPAIARGLFWLDQAEQGKAQPPGVKVRIKDDLVRRLGARKRPGEALADVLDRTLRECFSRDSSGTEGSRQTGGVSNTRKAPP